MTPNLRPEPTGPAPWELYEPSWRHLKDDLGALSQLEQALVGLRAEGRSFQEIADQLGAPITPATVQRQFERAAHHLRGRIHVRIWRQDPLGSWRVPRCRRLAELTAHVERLLIAGCPLTTTLYRDIGRHLDPHPGSRAPSLSIGDQQACSCGRTGGDDG